MERAINRLFNVGFVGITFMIIGVMMFIIESIIQDFVMLSTITFMIGLGLTSMSLGTIVVVEHSMEES